MTEDLYILVPQPLLVSTNSQTETLSRLCDEIKKTKPVG
jgi:hypothetical protein